MELCSAAAASTRLLLVIRVRILLLVASLLLVVASLLLVVAGLLLLFSVGGDLISILGLNRSRIQRLTSQEVNRRNGHKLSVGFDEMHGSEKPLLRAKVATRTLQLHEVDDDVVRKPTLTQVDKRCERIDRHIRLDRLEQTLADVIGDITEHVIIDDGGPELLRIQKVGRDLEVKLLHLQSLRSVILN